MEHELQETPTHACCAHEQRDRAPRGPDRPDATYTCPMHPEVRQVGPGDCPICGMALEPLAPTLDDPAAAAELAQMRRRFFVSAALTLPVFVIAMSDHLPGLHLRGRFSPTLLGWIELALATPVVAWCGAPLFARGARSVATRQLNMFTLIALGVGVAYAYSLVAVLAPGIFPSSMRDAHGGVGLYFEAAAVIVTLVLLGQVLEIGARNKAGSAIRALLELAPAKARRVNALGFDEEVPLESVRAGDVLRVRPGEKVPVDGRILKGESQLDESLLSGESIPIGKGPGDPVVGGSINGSGSFTMRAERVGADTLLARIVEQVAAAQRSRAPIQRLADRVASWFVPAVIVAALLSFVLWLALGPEPRVAHALVAAVSVLIIACPCALGLATPMSILVASGRGARSGLLFKDAEAIERLCAIDTLVLDKTGTLTAGKPRLASSRALAGIDEAELLRLAAGLELASEHPLAAAIVAGARERGLEPRAASEFRSEPGKGVVGEVEGRTLALGSERWLAELGVDVSLLAPLAEERRAAGESVVLLALDGRPAGLVGVADPIKDSTRKAIAELRAQGLRLVVLSGDARASVAAVARELGIDDSQAELLPEQKLAAIDRLRERGARVAMAGDGVNDAPALARAEVGIALGTGTDVAMESAGLTLVQGDLGAIPRAIRLSRATVRNIRQNLFFAFGYNALGIPIAAGALYPVTGALLSPMIAAAAMSLSSVSVIANALRLRNARL